MCIYHIPFLSDWIRLKCTLQGIPDHGLPCASVNNRDFGASIQLLQHADDLDIKQTITFCIFRLYQVTVLLILILLSICSIQQLATVSV